MTSPPLDSIVGRTVAAVATDEPADGDGSVTLTFTDGTSLTVSGVWHNDRTAGVCVTLGEGE